METSEAPRPLLFQIRENTYLGAFAYAALTSAVTAAVVLEYRFTDPFMTYGTKATKDTTGKRERLLVTDVLQTCAVSFVATMLALVLLHICFAVGDSLVVNDN